MKEHFIDSNALVIHKVCFSEVIEDNLKIKVLLVSECVQMIGQLSSQYLLLVARQSRAQNSSGLGSVSHVCTLNQILQASNHMLGMSYIMMPLSMSLLNVEVSRAVSSFWLKI
jgi:hypothetical protein